MDFHDIKLLSPEISMGALGIIIILLDMITNRKGVLATVSVVGLAVPLSLSLYLCGLVDSDSEGKLSGVYGTVLIDQFSLFFKFFILGTLALVILSSTDYLSKLGRLRGEYHALLIFSAAGMMLLPAVTDLISIYIAIELTALPLAALIAIRRDSHSTEAGIKFLLLSAMSSAVLLYGMALIYGFTGSTEIEVIIERIAYLSTGSGPFGERVILLAVVLIVAGIGFKISVAPFQMWVPDVYEGAPTPITSYLSVASKAAGFAIMLRIFYMAFGDIRIDWASLFAILSAVSMTVGNLAAVIQTNIKRMLAYSTVAHAGFLLMGLAAVGTQADLFETPMGPGSVLFYLVAYAVTNLAAFFVIIAVVNSTRSNMIRNFAGMGQRAPVLAIILSISMISLLGIPPTVGFMGKLYIFSAAINSGLTWLVICGVLNSVVSAYYYLRVIRTMYMLEPESDTSIQIGIPPRMAIGIVGIGILVLGIIPSTVMNAAEKAVIVFF
ncbi:MAG: NADH-quinone oxidoreductase subunit N [SAR202 cluster bacterium]|nr:NADH-quinone oxidoreductase subunit N [SAR202 cluster bacterium]|tara:strand:- start:4932 stop:6416 length:1485 start_codon:yes stop_codon:yes gene_type:complete